MQPGDSRPANENKTVTLAVTAWVEKHEPYLEIHIIGDGELFNHTTVNNNPVSPRYHRTIFRNLRRLLIASGKWPYGNEGIETEEENRVG